MKKIPVLFLVVLFIAVLVYGMLVYRAPALPEGFQTGSPATTGQSSSIFDQFFELGDDESDSGSESSSDSESTSNQNQNGGAQCPSSASRDAQGKIHVEPTGQVFDSMIEYVEYMTELFNKPGYGMCIVPTVRAYTGPQEGVLGGEGNGSASGDQVAMEGADRSVINTALLDAQNKELDRMCESRKSTGGVTMLENPGELTSARTPINKLDDYEYSRVFELENAPRNSQLSKAQKDALTNQYQLDWSVLPFNSEKRSQIEEAFTTQRMEDGFRDPKTGVFFRNMEGASVTPPDEETQQREQKVLTGYQPTDLTTHVVDDEMERVAKVVAQTYAADGDWEPVVEKRGDHQYAVTELRPRRKKEEWEGEETPTIQQAKDQGLLTGESLQAAVDISDRQHTDPFFDKSGLVDYDNNRVWKYQDFNKWTPGLERMFAPTNDTQAWF